MVVVVIIGLLAALVGPEIWSMFFAGQQGVAETRCKQLHGNVKTWMSIRKTSLPDSLDDLEAPLTKGDDQPFISNDPDPWGNPYFINPLGRRKFQICSPCPDGEEETEDDICYPTNEDE